MQKLIFITLFFTCFLNSLSINSLFISQEEDPSEKALNKAQEYLNALQKYYDAADYELHKTYSDSLFLLATDNHLTKMRILALTNQAVYYKNRSDRLKAIELYHQALESCKLIPDDYRTRIVVLVNMGNIYTKIGSYQKSIDYFEQVITDLDTYENSDRIRAATLVGLGNSYNELGDIEKTINYSKEAKLIGEQINNETVIISAVNNISKAYNESKRYKKALEINETAKNLAFLNKPTKQKTQFLLNSAISHYYLDNLKESKRHLLNCVKLSSEKQLFEIEMFAHEYLAKIYEKEGDYKNSVKEQKAYAAIRELYLEDRKEASNADLNNEIDSKSEAIEASNEALQNAEKNKNLLVYIGGAVLIALTGLLFVYIKRKKTLDAEKDKLQSQYIKLKENISNQNTKSSSLNNKELETTKPEKKPYKNSSLTDIKRNELKTKILAFMHEEKPYLNPEMTQADLANQLEISSHHLSEVLYYNMEQNFYNFINSYRILEAQNLMKDSSYVDSKILTIAFDSGFKSKTTFNRIFKNHTNTTPSEYRKAISTVSK